MKSLRLPFVLLVATPLVFGQNERWFIAPDSDLGAGKQTAAAILKAACEGTVDGTSCSKCPTGEDSAWSISSLVMGHFSSAAGEEAFIGTRSCYYPGPGAGIGVLLRKRNGKWTKLEDIILAFEPDHCMRRKFRSGREFLICESNDYLRDGEVTYTLKTLMVENDQSKFHNLFTAADTTRTCREGKGQKAAIQNVEFRDLNGDGSEDISITATYGSFPMTGARLHQCEAFDKDRIQSDGKPKMKPPQPAIVRTYKIDLLFDGNRYTPTPESRAAVALFHWEY
jgi:hypothetical protein